MLKVRLYPPVLGRAFHRRPCRRRWRRLLCWIAPRSRAAIGEPLYLDVVTALSEARSRKRSANSLGMSHV